jgi:hypothetical protein
MQLEINVYYLCGVSVALVGAPEYMNLIGERWTGTYITLVHLQAGHVNIQTQETLHPEKQQIVSFFTFKDIFYGSKLYIQIQLVK